MTTVRRVLLPRVPLALAALLLLAGCETLQSINPFGDDAPEADEPAPLPAFTEEVRFERRWDVQVGDGLGRKYLTLVPAVASGRVYAADGYGHVEARDAGNGRRVWATRIGEAEGRGFGERMRFWERGDHAFVTGGVGAGDGIVLVGTANGEVVALDDLDGHEVWRAQVSSEVMTAPVTDGDVVLLQTLDGRLVALDRETGAQRWRFDTQVPILTLRGAAAPVLAGGVVIAGFPNGRVVALRAGTGEPLWEQRVATPKGRSELDRIVDVDGAPLVVGEVVYVGSYQGAVRALRLGDGTPGWEHEVSTHVGLAAGLDQIYVVSSSDDVLALGASGANVAWESKALHLRALTSPAVIENYVIVGDGEGYVHALAQSDGRVAGRRHIDGDGLRGGFAVADGVLYGLSNGGRLFALELAR